ncbi:MAG: CCA tRNA nucleotidyltransferase [Vulcanimicrobiaceae bacterium]
MADLDVRAIDAALAAALPAGALFAVGGRVRDELRAEIEGAPLAVKDLDYVVTGLALDELTARLSRIGKTDVVGASFAVVKWSRDGVTVDLALPRRERSTGAGHRDFAVECGPAIPLAEDLARRDFRMNMLARALPAGDLVDPYGGETDIRRRRIDILRPAAFVEDPLRMLRAGQFAARFAYAPTEATREAMRSAAPLVATVSPERVRDEFVKLIGLAERPSIGLELLRETGVLGYVLPELIEGVGVEQNEWHAFDVYRHAIATLDATPQGDLSLRFAALLHDIGKPRTKVGPHFYRHEIVGESMTIELMDRLRFSLDEQRSVAHLVRHHMYAADPEFADATIRRFVRRVGPEYLDRQFALRAADVAGSGLPKRDDGNERFQDRVRQILAQRPPFSVRDLAIGGSEVLAALIAAGRLPIGSRGGPQVGRILRELFERVTDDPALNEHARLLDLVKEGLARSDG